MGVHSYEGENHMSEPNGFADHAAPATVTDGISPKALASGATGLLVGIVVAVLNAVTESNLLGGLPPTVQVLLLAAIPPVLSYLAAYQAGPGTVTVKRT
jgi:hypothetical protein